MQIGMREIKISLDENTMVLTADRKVRPYS